MFKELMNLKYKRSAKQAIGFYIIYFLIGILLSAILAGSIVSILARMGMIPDTQTAITIGQVVGACCSIVYCFSLSLLILISKRLYTSIPAILLTLLTILAAAIMGSFLGCICPAILSAFQPKNK